jgi:hypothetical protein
MGGGTMDKSRIRYQLFRSIVDADQTFNLGYDITAYKQGKSGTKLGAPSTIRAPHPDTLVSEQVLDVGFIFYELNKNGDLVESWPNRDGSLQPTKSGNVYRVPADGMPQKVDIYVRVISRSGAQKLAAREAGGMRADDWWKAALEDSRLYKRVMRLRWAE